MKQRKKLLLHTCCGPCLTHVHSVLCAEYEIAVFYYNPNIAPQAEYAQRLSEVKQFTTIHNIVLLTGRYNQADWFKAVREQRFSGELSPRCYLCYSLRLKETFDVAKQCKYDVVCTTLSVSPYKDAEKINEIGRSFAELYGIQFIEADFKQNGGYQHSIVLSKQYGMYRQKYCGCVYSRLERNKNSLWSIKSNSYKKNMITANNKY